MIDPKPLGAFFEYTLRPFCEDFIEILDRMEAQGLPLEKALKSVWKLYIFDRLTTMVTSLIITGAICFTLWHSLSTRT